MSPSADYTSRSVDRVVDELFAELPALELVGPRASGKTTTALQHARTVIRLDQPAQAAAFAADPDAALRDLEEPVLLDEWQMVPSVLGAVKRAVDVDFRPGRFLLTGSAEADIAADAWPGTGRIVRLPMFGLTVAERRGRPDVTPLVDRVVDGAELHPAEDTPDLRGYVELALESGFPEAARLSGPARAQWLEGYVEQLVRRDAASADRGRDADRLRRYFEAYAVNTGGNVADTTLGQAADVNRVTADSYERLLSRLFVVHAAPAWSSNRLRRLVKSPKRYLVDAGLITGLLRVDVNTVMGDGDLLGRVLDTFAAAELRAQAVWAASRPHLYHLREQDGRREVDIVAEVGAERIVGIEVKAHAAPTPDAARHLSWLRDQLEDRFVGGVVLHTGPRTFSLGEGIVAAPISTLWA